MKRSLITGSLITVLVALVCISLAGIAVAQDPSEHAMYKALPPHSYYPVKPAEQAAQLAQWTFNWTSSFNNRTYHSVIVGADPSVSNATTTVTVGVIPIIMVYGPTNGNQTFDPSTPYFKNFSTTQMVLNSPMFKGNEFDFNQGGTDLGKTQYIDAYERGNFWGSVQTNTKYHLILKTVPGPAQTFNVPANVGKVTNSGFAPNPVGTADINWFDQQLQGVINKYKQIQPNVLPLFITYNVYLTSGGCCIGGYHSANGPQPFGQTYSYSTVIDQFSNGRAAFGQDIGALAHELGEWTLDPFVNNASPCPSNGILENGDPLENGPNFGDYPYTIDGFTFHPQDLVFITWFGAPPATSLNVWNGVPTNVVTFQNEVLRVCQTR
jgi:hypothetical protein